MSDETTPPLDDRDAAIAAICVMAAFADGQKNDAERERLRGVLDGAALAAVYQQVLLKRTTLEAEVARLEGTEERQLVGAHAQ
jgi:hypothetical protein